MAMKLFKEVKVSTGEYTNAQGEEKKSYSKVGILLKDDDNGRMAIKLDTLPMGQIGNDGKMACWLSLFDPYDKDAQPQQVGVFGSQQAVQQPQVQPMQQPQPQYSQPQMQPVAQNMAPQPLNQVQQTDANGIPF